jgi:hypothetical protein
MGAKLGATRTDRRHWRAAVKFLAASIVKRTRQELGQDKRWWKRNEEDLKGTKEVSRRRADPTGTQTALVL